VQTTNGRCRHKRLVKRIQTTRNTQFQEMCTYIRCCQPRSVAMLLSNEDQCNFWAMPILFPSSPCPCPFAPLLLFPSLPPPLPSGPLPLPSLVLRSPSLPLEVGPLNPARGLGERYKLPSRNRIWCILALITTSDVSNFNDFPENHLIKVRKIID